MFVIAKSFGTARSPSSEKQAITVALHESGIAEKVFEQLDLEELNKQNGIRTFLFSFR